MRWHVVVNKGDSILDAMDICEKYGYSFWDSMIIEAAIKGGAAVHELLTELLRHPTPILYLALLSRRDPPLPIHSLRALGRLTEIGVEHLRFTLAETTAFLERFLHVTIDEKTASVLEEKMEGWVTGLRLSALSVGRREDLGRVLQGPEARQPLCSRVSDPGSPFPST